MGKDSKIAWTHHTFNPWVGCQRVSPGCMHCYAEAYDARVGGVPKKQRANPEVAETRWGPSGRRTRTSASNWNEPLKWNRAAEKAGERHRVFCSSLADVFEDRFELIEWRAQLLDLIVRTSHLDWLLLTKRPQSIAPLLRSTLTFLEAEKAGYCDAAILLRLWLDGVGTDDGRPCPPLNVWLGTTVEDQRRADERIPHLLAVPARVHFLSCEPLLEHLDLDRIGLAWRKCSRCDGRFSLPVEGGGIACPDCLAHQGVEPAGIDWVIIGGESGPGARPFNVAWARSLLRQCRESNTAAFMKQLGANVRTRNDDGLISDFSEGGWFLNADWQVEDDVHGFREDHQGAEVRVRLVERAGADPNEWPVDLRVREFPRGSR